VILVQIAGGWRNRVVAANEWMDIREAGRRSRLRDGGDVRQALIGKPQNYDTALFDGLALEAPRNCLGSPPLTPSGPRSSRAHRHRRSWSNEGSDSSRIVR